MNPESLINLQTQVRRNQQDIQDFVKDLNSWESSIGKKDEQLKNVDLNKDKVALLGYAIEVVLMGSFHRLQWKDYFTISIFSRIQYLQFATASTKRSWKKLRRKSIKLKKEGTRRSAVMTLERGTSTTL